MKAWNHFVTITRHRWQVRQGCFQVGLYWQGLTHDLSKYHPIEFSVGAKYYQGTSSPNNVERKEKGYSESWMHHKGRNRHHWEYWTDLNVRSHTYEPVHMPRKYLVEMIMDRRAACMIYQGEKYTQSSPLEYLQNSREKARMHPETLRELTYILTMLSEAGEEKTFRYLKEDVLTGKPFPWELEETT